jgi:nicotinamide riboside kinase
MIVINLHGGPGVGKSTAASGLVNLLKECDINAEHVQEFAKELIYAKNFEALKNQNWVFANQEYRQHILRDKVQVAVTDSPLILSAYYGEKEAGGVPRAMRSHIFNTFGSYDNFNVFIERNPTLTFQQEGRMHDKIESDVIAEHLKHMLNSEGIPYQALMSGDELPARIFTMALRSRLLDVSISKAARAERIVLRGMESERAGLGVTESPIITRPPKVAEVPRRRASLAVASQ